jgi:hypothetical protein
LRSSLAVCQTVSEGSFSETQRDKGDEERAEA